MNDKNSMIADLSKELPTNPIFDVYKGLIINLTADFSSHNDINVNLDDGLFSYQLNEKQEDFFEKLYIVGVSNSFSIPPDIYETYPELKSLKIGKNEWQLIDFVTSPPLN